jgi:hypothetical protein
MAVTGRKAAPIVTNRKAVLEDKARLYVNLAILMILPLFLYRFR